MISFSDMPRPTAGRPAPSIQCPACPSLFGTKQGLSQHCSKIHNNPLAVLLQIRHEPQVSPSIPCCLTHVIAVMSIAVMRSVQPLPMPQQLQRHQLLQMRPVNCGMLQDPVQGQMSLRGII